MPLFSLTSKKAMGQLQRNTLARWPDGRRGNTRLDGVVLPATTPGFVLRNGDAVFTIGSCFARNIEARLQELGFRVPACAIALPREERGSDMPNGILNKYNPHSMVNELVWAFEQPYPAEAYLRVGTNLWHDPHLVGNTAPAPLKRLRARRAMVTRLFRQLPRCRTVIVTLGLVEAWYDCSLGLYLNTAPPAVAMAREPERFRFDVLDHAEVLAELERLWTLIRTNGHSKVRMLLTVSPVPLRATYTGQDVLVANSYSKSVLRAAAGALAAAHPEIDYFPSFETGTLTARSTAFQEDNRHVAPELVNAIMDRVVGAYVRAEPGAIEEVTARAGDENDASLAAQVRDHIKMGRAVAARRLMDPIAAGQIFEGTGFTEFSFRFLYAKLLADAGDILHAEVELARCLELQPDSAMIHYALGRVVVRLQRPLRAEEMFRRVVEMEPAHVDARLRLGRMEARNGKLADAEQTGLAALALAPDNADVIEMLADVRAAAAAEWGGDEGDIHSEDPGAAVATAQTWLERARDRLRPRTNRRLTAPSADPTR